MTTTETFEPVVADDGRLQITFETPPGTTEIWDAYQALKNRVEHDPENYSTYQKLTLHFREPVTPWAGRKKRRPTESFKALLFMSANSLCYTVTGRRGRAMDYEMKRHLMAISYESRETLRANDRARMERLLGRRHPNAWQHLTLEDLKYQQPSERNIKRHFPENAIKIIEQAFEEQDEVKVEGHSDTHRHTVNTKVVDGKGFCAWYSCEPHGLCHGMYYLLINPTTAAFGEKD